MEISNIIPHIEALIFASDKPLTALEITELMNNAFSFMEDKLAWHYRSPDVQQLALALAEIERGT